MQHNRFKQTCVVVLCCWNALATLRVRPVSISIGFCHSPGSSALTTPSSLRGTFSATVSAAAGVSTASRRFFRETFTSSFWVAQNPARPLVRPGDSGPLPVPLSAVVLPAAFASVCAAAAVVGDLASLAAELISTRPPPPTDVAFSRARHWSDTGIIHCASSRTNLLLYRDKIHARWRHVNGAGKLVRNKPRFIFKQESPALAREDVMQLIQYLLQYWPSRSSKVDDFHLI